MPVSTRIATRISSELKRYQGILDTAKQRDVSESNTSAIVGDMLSDIFGYDKYHHVTREHAIRGTYVDLAVMVDEEIRFLVEVKAIGIELKDAHVKQAIDYGANLGIEWIVLTNGAIWRLYKIQFSQPIEKTLVFELDVLSAKPKNNDVVECLGSLCKEGFSKGSMSELHQQKQITSRFSVAAVLLSEDILDELRKELRKLSPGLKVDTDYLRGLLENEIIKRELVDSEEAQAATSLVKRMQRSVEREKKKRVGEEIRIPPEAGNGASAGAVTSSPLPSNDVTSP